MDSLVSTIPILINTCKRPYAFIIREQTVNISGVPSSTKDLKYGIPQGSVLGSLLFSVNLLPLRKIITDYGVPFELYADDNQLYIIFNNPKGDVVNIALRSTASDTPHWLTMNFQKVNDTKTEMVHTSSMHLQPVELSSFVGDQIITPTDSGSAV